MTQPTDSQTPHDDPQLLKSAADDYVSVLAENEEDEEGDDDSSSGKSGGKGLGKYKVILDPILDFADDINISEEENTIAKLRKLGLAPMSMLAAGGSAFASENDLSRKVFMAEVAQFNKEIQPRDIANPKLFQILESKKLERIKAFGIKTLDDIITGAVGAAGAAIAYVSSSVSDVVKEKKEARKLNKIAKDFEEGKETYTLDSDDDYASKSSLEAADFPVQDNQGNELISNERERIYDSLSRQTQYELDTGKIGFAEAFNILADIMLLGKEPVRTVKLENDFSFNQDDPGIDKELNPMGG
jgi:hypothetical protein